jgi:hypothetical protein
MNKVVSENASSVLTVASVKTEVLNSSTQAQMVMP